MPSLSLPTAFGCIRDAQPEDAPLILPMVASLAAHHGDSATLTKATLLRDAFGPCPWVHVLVADVADGLAGYAALCHQMQLQFGARRLDLHHLFTAPTHRGQGIGGALIDACRIKAAQLSCHEIVVGTHPDNHAAQAFYEAQGFTRLNHIAPRFRLRLAYGGGSGAVRED